MPTEVKNKVCLMYVLFNIQYNACLTLDSVHDGWGIATEKGLKGNAIEAGTTTNMDTIAKDHSHRKLAAHGTAVGLSEGLMGNSEVGYIIFQLFYFITNYHSHLNIGAGRIVWQDIVRIDVSIKKREFHKNKTIVDCMKKAKEGNGRLHLLGLVCSYLDRYQTFIKPFLGL